MTGKMMYIGVTIPGIAARNTVTDGIPPQIAEASKEAPFLAELCVPIRDVPAALEQIRQRSGATYTFYLKALEYRAKLKEEE